ncbi:hypothetical protein KR222_008044, partial [Zaprionus bogoriensis]
LAMSSWLQQLLSISRWLGVSPALRQQQRQLQLAWSLLLLACIWTVCIRLVISKLHMPVLAIEKLLYLTEYPANMLLTALFSLSVYRDAGYYRRLWLQQQKLQALLFERAAQLQEQMQRHVRQQLLLILCFHGICVVIDVLWMRLDWLSTLHSNVAHNLVGLMISLSLLQYVLALRLICLLHAQLNKQLCSLIPSSICIIGQVHGHGVEQLRLAWAALNQLHAQFSRKFGVVLLLNFSNSLLSFSYELFNVFRMLEQADWTQWVLLSYRLLWLLMHGMRIWTVLRANERILEQKCQLCLLLNQLQLQDARLERAVNRFLLQLQANEGCPSTVLGVLELDTLTLGGFISALMAIVIFLIQIDLGNKSLMG